MARRPLLLSLIVYLWALPTTLLGLWLLPVALVTGGSFQVVEGVLEIHGGAVAWLLRHATLLEGVRPPMTFGHVVLGAMRPSRHSPAITSAVHVAQAERWGPLFIPAYLLGSALALVRAEAALPG